jgi:hypothetical protein
LCDSSYVLSNKILFKNKAKIGTDVVPELIDKGLDIWTDYQIFTNISSDIFRIVYKIDNDYKVILNDFIWGKDLAVKYADRLNKIYKGGEFKSLTDKSDVRQYRYLSHAVISLNYSMNRPNLIDHDYLLSILPTDITNDHAKLFNKKVDLESVHRISPISIESCVVKDYTNGIRIHPDDLKHRVKGNSNVSLLLDKLKGKKVTFKISKDSLTNLRRYNYSSYDKSDEDKRVMDLINKFPQLIKVDAVKSDGDISIIVTRY